MDHFNSTVKDGKLIHTKRGLQVSKQKFNGLSFVNSTPESSSSSSVPSSSSNPSSAAGGSQRQFKFVEKNQEKPKAQRKKRDGEDLQVNRPKSRRTTPTPPIHASPSQPPASSSTGYDLFQSKPPNPPIIFQQQQQNLYQPNEGEDEDEESDEEENRRLFNHYFDYIPRMMYPFEDLLTYNPAERGSEFYDLVLNDRAALHCVLMCGSIAEALLNPQDKACDAESFAYHIPVSKICSNLNRKLDHSSGNTVDAVTLHCIATLAWMGCYVGRVDHWHMHMRGLQKILDVNGGLDGLPPFLVAEIHKTDLKGAMALASSPYLPFTRRHTPISTTVVLPANTPHTYISQTLNTLLEPLGIGSVVVRSLVDLAVFSTAVQQPRNSPDITSLRFDPHAFTDEWLNVMNALLTQPGPLQPDHAPLEAALRVAGLLYLKELLPDYPRNIGGYAVLLELLATHLTKILHEDHANTERAPVSVSRKGKQKETIDPQLRNKDNKAQGSSSNNAGQQQKARMMKKAVVLWLCVVGDRVARIAGEVPECQDEQQEEDDDDDDDDDTGNNNSLERDIYRDCLVQVAGLTVDTVDTLDDNELVMFRLFDLSPAITPRQDQQSQPEGREKWDARVTLKAMLQQAQDART
ncbi:hypothetical protein QBC46DRAFT_364055 [Diplogelasinospora grovesii]|uniref:Uncharacterized protein n=1 Tax=Diplogelasinospora grovesii TaxID=303347 RepID=A0AAN6S4V5_9PEZI|nr:hypothetical protein QBC46DRAFT_364055 [Diplogelasinospora grovesii]